MKQSTYYVDRHTERKRVYIYIYIYIATEDEALHVFR